MPMNLVSTLAFYFVAVAFFTLGYRNLLWTIDREKRRLRLIVDRGLAAHLFSNAVWLILFGGILAYAARGVPDSVAWQTLGLAIVVLGALTFLVARFGSVRTPALESMPVDEELRKRVSGRRFSGSMFLLGGVAWVWNGAPLAFG